jgi:hypothetical protein
MNKLTTRLSASEARLDNGDLPAHYPSEGDRVNDVISELGYEIVEAIANLSLAAQRESSDLRHQLGRIADALELLARPWPVGRYIMVMARIDKESSPTLYATGKVIGYRPEISTVWLREPFDDSLIDVRLHTADDDDEEAHEVWARWFENEADLVQAIKQLYAQEKWAREEPTR